MSNFIFSRMGYLKGFMKAQINQVIGWNRPQWFNILFLSAVLLLLQQKEISLHFNMSEDASDREHPPATQVAQSNITGLAFSDNAPLSNKVESVIQQAKTYLGSNFQSVGKKLNDTPHKTRTVNDNLANTYSNMTYGKQSEQLNVAAIPHSSKKNKYLLKRQKQNNYVSRFAKVAQAEMVKYGIPASITLAQGLIESNAGESRLSKKNNNHFGMKCFSKRCSKGHCSNFTDDSHKDFFRAYETAWESFRAHSILLTGKRYRRLFRLDKKDYKGWATGLKKAGYATDPNYAKKLIHIIEELELYKYDQ